MLTFSHRRARLSRVPAISCVTSSGFLHSAVSRQRLVTALAAAQERLLAAYGSAEQAARILETFAAARGKLAEAAR